MLVGSGDEENQMTRGSLRGRTCNLCRWTATCRLSLLLVAVLLWLGLGQDGLGGGRGSRVRDARATASSGRPRILVCIASHHDAQRSTAHLERLLESLATDFAPLFRVTVWVDTNSEALGPLLAALPFSPRLALRTRVWSLAELGNPLHLPFVHRHAMGGALGDFDFFWFTEDDVLLPLAAFQLYVARREELWERGWLFGWVRAERWGGDNVTAISVDNIVPLMDPVLYATPAGHVYAEPWSPYTAFYILDARQLAAMMGDTQSKVWFDGFPPFLPRERMSVGWNFAFTRGKGEPYGAKGWRARVMVPVTMPQGKLDPRAVAWHLPQKYARANKLFFKDLGAVPVDALFNWTAGRPVATPRTLPQLPMQ